MFLTATNALESSRGIISSITSKIRLNEISQKWSKRYGCKYEKICKYL